MEIIILLLIIFGVYKLFSRKTKSGSYDVDREKFLHTQIAELSRIAYHSPNKTITELLKDYKDELNRLQHNPSTPEVKQTSSPTSGVETGLYSDINDIFANWYSENSINLLLYVGAFLIVASASIFVGFQWETIDGMTKALTLCFITIAFFGFGLWFYQMPKIQNAGLTFTSIGTLLFPMCGIAFYNFVLKDQGVSFGTVWFVTSALSLFIYIYFIQYFKKPFFTYFSSLATISVLLSLVNIYQLNPDYYILMAILASFLLFLTKLYLLSHMKKEELVIRPLEICSNLSMGIALVFGFGLAIANNKLFSFESTLSLFLAAIYYALSYLTLRKPWQFLLTLCLLPLTTIIWFTWREVDQIVTCYALQALAFGLIFFSTFVKQSQRLEEGDISEAVGIILTLLTSLFSLTTRTEDYNKGILNLITVVNAFYATYLTKRYQYILMGSLFIAISLHYFINLFHFSSAQYIKAIAYMLIALGYYFFCVIKKQIGELQQPLVLSVIFFFILSYIFAFNDNTYLLIISSVITLVFFSAHYYFKNVQFIYFSNIFLSISTLSFLTIMKTDYNYYPFVFSGLSIALYAISLVIPSYLRNVYRNSSLVATLMTPIVFGIKSNGYDYYGVKKELERNALMTAYVTTGLFSLDAYSDKDENKGYVASAIGILTYLWQIKFLGITETQLYSLPLGVYFMILGFLRRLKGKFDQDSLFTLLGLVLLIVPTFLQSYGERGYAYAFLLGALGGVILFLGMTLRHKIYSYAGVVAIILAVFSQIYEYIYSLPRWLITGVVGLLFLAVAIYLMQNRKEVKH